MDLFSSFLQTLKIKKIEVVSSNLSIRDTFIMIIIAPERAKGWSDLIMKLNFIYGDCLSIEKQNTENTYKITFSEKQIEVALKNLNYAVMKNEYFLWGQSSGIIYDVKLGISCNNNCFHCVIKPTVLCAKKKSPESVILDSGLGMWHTQDPSFRELINRISFKKNISSIVLTGGEPTIREDFVVILKWLYYNRPDVQVTIQTNGRNLANENLVKSILRYTRDNIFFVIAIHGTEVTHNNIVNNRREQGNPFKETLMGIKNLLKYNLKNIRTEIVISNKNKNELAEAVRFQHEELGISIIGISYPHLFAFSKKDRIKIAPPMGDLILEIKKINKYLEKTPNLQVLTEEIPPCFYAKIDEPIYIQAFGTPETKTSVCCYDGCIIEDFNISWKNDHKKIPSCAECLIDRECPGVWKETLDLNRETLSPLKELIKKVERC